MTHPPPQYILPPIMGNVGSRSIIGELSRMRCGQTKQSQQQHNNNNNNNNSTINNNNDTIGGNNNNNSSSGNGGNHGGVGGSSQSNNTGSNSSNSSNNSSSNNNNSTNNDDESHDHLSHQSETSDAENIMSRGNNVVIGKNSGSNKSSDDQQLPKRSLKKESSSSRVGEASGSGGGSAGLAVLVKGEDEDSPMAHRVEAEFPIGTKRNITDESKGKGNDDTIPTTSNGDNDDNDSGDDNDEKNAPAADHTEHRTDAPSTPPTEGESIHSSDDNDDDDDDIIATTTTTMAPSVPDIRIGRTGNPVGSLGYFPSLEEDVMLEKKKDEDKEVGLEGEEDGGLEVDDEVSKLPEEEEEEDDDDISNDANNESNVTHFPLEISTDDGGVSALLPSGRILVDRTGSGGSTSDDCHVAEGDAAEVAGGVPSETTREDAAAAVPEQCEEDDSGEDGAVVSSTEDSTEEETRRNTPPSEMALGTPYPLGSKGEGGGNGGAELVTPTPEQEEEEESLLQVTTTSSSVSEDPTFNSYAPSEMSSMMSHLEIQHLLKQGRQQEHDYNMIHNNNNNHHRLGGLPETVSGGGIGGFGRPTMVLYSNQSLYAVKKERDRGSRGVGEDREGGGPPSEASGRRPLPTSSSRTTLPPPLPAGDDSSASRDFFQVRPAQSSSSSSHGLLRVDAMEDERSYLFNNDRLRDGGGPMQSAGGGAEDVYYRIPHPPPQQQQYRQQQQEQFYPHLLGQASTLTTMPSMTSTITSVQSARHPLSSNHGGGNNHAIYQSHGAPSRNHYVVATPPPPQMRMPPTARIGGDYGGDEKDEDEDTFFHELKSASPLRSCASTAPSVVEEDSIEGVGVRVEVEVGLKQRSDESGDGGGSSEEDDGGMAIATVPSHGQSLDGGSFRTSSTDGRRSVQSLLGTSTKSLADDLIQHDEESGEGEVHEEGGNVHIEHHLGGAPVNDVDKGRVAPAAAESLRWNANPLPPQSSSPYVPSSYIDPSPSAGGGGDDDDGYSADRSTGYALENANRIEEYSTSANSYFGGQRDLRQGLPMAGDSEDDTVNSHHHHFGYGHNYDHERLPLPYSNNRPMGAIPSTFPSLMDASVSSALTASTAPSVAMGFVSGRSVVSTQQRRNGENEEREDSLPLTARNYDALPQEMDLVMNSPIVPQQQSGVAMRHHDPLTSTSPAMLSAEGEFALPVATHEMPPPSALNDPRMNVDYERHYIVDLERINEESSGNHDLSSAGGRRFGASGSVSSPRTSSASSPRASSPRATSLSPPPRRVPAGDDPSAKGRVMGASAEFQRGQPPMIPEAYISQKQQPLLPNSPKPTQFYNYRHQYYTEQYHYCDERFSQSYSKGGNGNGGDCDDSDSTCSSVTLSQAFRHSNDGNESTCSSITDTECYSESHATHVSTVSSVTLSCALSVDKHVHSDQGFYVATRLGDFVEVPNEGSDGEEEDDDDDDNECYGVVGDEATNTMNDGPAYFSTVYEGDEESASIEVEKSVDPHGIYNAGLEKVDVLGTMASADDNVTMTTNGTTADISNKSPATTECDEIDAISDCALGSKGHLENGSNDDDSGRQKKNSQDAAAAKVAATQIASAKADDIESDILSALVPECGAPIPSVMARIGGSSATGRSPGRSKGGMLLPWHSTRSIQNYQGRRGKNKKGSNASVYSSRTMNGSLFSIGSVHTFRG